MENQRVRISKKMLKESLIHLLRENDIQKITIQEICQKAQINRTTFYKYYGSQYDLLDDIEKDIFDELQISLKDCESSDPDTTKDALTQTLVYFENERDRCHLLLNSTTDKEFADKLFRLPIIQSLVKKYTPREYTENQAKYVQTFITYGGYAIIRDWMNTEERETPEEMSQFIQNLMWKPLAT